jgi:hypothetical protein
MDHSEEIGSWAESADRSLTASLLLGRGSARAIAKAHLSELYKLVEGDRDVALAEISKVNSFGSRRLLMESFRQTFSLIYEHPKYHILLEDIDFNDKTVARQYDQALLKLFRECGNNKNLLTAKLSHYPVKKRKIAIKRLEHPDFQKSRRIKLNQNLFYGLTDSELERGPLSWWQWLAVFLMISLFVFIFTS